MIERSNPDVGYMTEEVFKAYAFTQTIRAGDTLYLSGIAPLRGDLKTLDIVGAGDLRAQLDWTLEVLERCLAAHQATFRNWVAQTVYTTSIPELLKVAAAFNEKFGEHTPTSTWIEVKGLFHPKQQIEITGIAVLR